MKKKVYGAWKIQIKRCEDRRIGGGCQRQSGGKGAQPGGCESGECRREGRSGGRGLASSWRFAHRAPHRRAARAAHQARGRHRGRHHSAQQRQVCVWCVVRGGRGRGGTIETKRERKRGDDMVHRLKLHRALRWAQAGARVKEPRTACQALAAAARPWPYLLCLPSRATTHYLRRDKL